jgi:DNA-directed RNA polymerase specialized sigma24 family protein
MPLAAVRQVPSPTSTATPSSPAIEELLRRVQAGERAAAAEFLLRYESRIRRRIRGKLGPDVRRLFDSLDIVSTLGRRLDLYVMSGQMRVGSESECLSLLFKMADRALIDKARVFRRLENVEREDSDFARGLASRLHAADRRARAGVEVEVESCMRLLKDPIDRRILSLWLTDEEHESIAQFVGLAAPAVRKRWQTIKTALRQRLQSTLA